MPAAQGIALPPPPPPPPPVLGGGLPSAHVFSDPGTLLRRGQTPRWCAPFLSQRFRFAETISLGLRGRGFGSRAFVVRVASSALLAELNSHAGSFRGCRADRSGHQLPGGPLVQVAQVSPAALEVLSLARPRRRSIRSDES